ncbi:MAG TPA: hypothetical protein VIQ00_11800 [Chitinophagaceae bacterium]|jgi:hypothetical protein
MLITTTIFGSNAKRKVAFITLMIASTFCAFATLGDGKGKNKQQSLLSVKKTNVIPGTFSLNSGYDYRGNHIINEQKNSFIYLNTTITYQKGNTTYILPLKRKVLLDKIKLTSSSRSLY